MSKVSYSEGPPARGKTRPPIDWTELIDAGLETPGEWVEMPIPEEMNPRNISGSLSFAVYKRVAELAIRRGTLYFRWLPLSETADEDER